MDKLKLETPNMTEKNIENIAKIFPNVMTETKDDNGEIKKVVDFDKLKQELSDYVIEGDESYDFTWVGKRESMLEANKPIRKTLRPDRESSIDWENTQNIYIEGDNLDALKLLQESYLGKIKMIYIDPPYNTGNDFIYKDNFTSSIDEYNEEIGIEDEDGNKLFQNTESNGRFHSDWCSMIYPRLKLARNLLTDDGVILISIDDEEIHNLRKICDEVLGYENFLCQFIWKSRQNKDNRNITGISIDHEYILAYSKIGNQRSFIGAERNTTQYSNPDNDPRGDWTSANMAGILDATQRPNCHYDLIDPKTGINYGKPTMGWRYDKNTMNKLINENLIIWPPTPEGRPRRKVFLKDMTLLPGFSSIAGVDIYTRNGSKEIADLFNAKYFSFPKPTELIKEFLKQTTSNDDIILDFFSGSATTADAVLQLNAEDCKNRRFIMVQLQELTEGKSEAYKAGYKNICEIGKERIRRAGKKIKEEIEQNNAQLKLGEEPKKVPDIGFRVFKVDDTNMNDVYYAPKDYNKSMLEQLTSNIKDDRTDEDLLYGVLLDWGVELSLPHKVEIVDNKKVHIVNDNELGADLIACFEQNISENVVREIAKKQPTRVVFRDNSFNTDDHKINVEEIFKLLAPNTTVKVI